MPYRALKRQDKPVRTSVIRSWIALVSALAVVASVLLASPAQAAPGPGSRGKAQPRVVVAVVDTAVNPYHEFFHRGGDLYGRSAPSSVTPQVLKQFGIRRQHIIRLTRTGDFGADFGRDAAKFDNIEAGQPYWFEGTNVIGISFRGQGERLRPDGNASPHGVGTTAAVLAANPQAIVVSVDGINSDSEEWAFNHPAVDLVSTSYGPVTGIPTLNHLGFSYSGVVENGKLHFGAATNDPTIAAFDQTSGPWWTIGVAGFQEGESEGRQVRSGTFADFVGDFTQELPYCRSCEEGTSVVSGTSFATPRSAGTFSRVLQRARRAAGHRGGIVTRRGKPPLMVAGKMSLTNWELRRALEEGAYYLGVDEYQPDPGSSQNLTSVPVVDAAPWLQTGWGALTPDPERGVVKETLAHLGIGGEAKRFKDAAACDFNTANIEARHLYWDNLAIFGESHGTTEDPYIYC